MNLNAEIDLEELKRLSEFTSQVQKERDNRWRNSCSKNGWELVADHSGVEDFQRSGQLGNLVELPPFLRMGQLRVESHLNDHHLEAPSDYLSENDFPALIHFRDSSAVCFVSSSQSDRSSRLAQYCLVRLCCHLDPALVKITAFDLSQFGSAVGVLSAASTELELITSEEKRQSFFQEIIQDVTERNNTRGLAYEYLYDYNLAHRDNTLPYHFIYISSYEQDLSESEEALLKKLIHKQNSAKAGVYFILVSSSREVADSLLELDPKLPLVWELESENDSRLEIVDPDGLETQPEGKHDALELIPDSEDITALSELAAYCQQHLKTRKREPVIFSPPSTEDLWEKSSIDELAICIGRGKGEPVTLTLGGGGLVYNVLIGGAVGTGKTILLHAVIIGAMRSYSPEELRVSLLDYKGGTEFSVYEEAPHLYALSLGHQTKFGLDLLIHFGAELERRADVFKQFDASNLSEFRRNSGEKLPRHLIVIDEFQVLLGDQKNGNEAQGLLEDLIRRGRSFGIHVVLSSQSLADGLLSSPSKSNLAGRICLRLSERECHEFLSVENSLPSTFTEPGQAVYNDSEGLREGNLEFRVAYYPQDEVEKAVLQLRDHGVESAIQVSSPYIYRSDSALKRADLPKEFSRPDTILLGVEEGIPREPVVASLAADSGPLLICGRKTVRNHLEAHLREIQEQNPERFTWLEDEGVDEFVSDSVADPSFTPRNCDVIILTINDKNAQNYELSEVLGRIIKESRLKLIILTDFPDTLNSLSFDQNRWEWLICTDRGSQESFAGFVEPDSTAGRNGLAAFFETGAMTPSLVRIPE